MAMSVKLKGRHGQERKEPPNEDSARLINIENGLEKLIKAITEPPQTYAQAAQRNAEKLANSTGNRPTPKPENGVKDRMEKIRQERAKTEVALTTRDATDSMKNQLSNMSEEALTNSLQQAIIAAGMEHVTIHRVQIC